jgi:flagellar protein FliS
MWRRECAHDIAQEVLEVNPNPYRQYQTVAIQTASTGELVLLLYDGAIRFLAEATFAIEQRRLDAASTSLFKAQEVVLELYAGLDYEQGGDLASNLSRLYIYMYETLLKANLKKDLEQIESVGKLLHELRAVWRIAVHGKSAAMTTGEIAA